MTAGRVLGNIYIINGRPAEVKGFTPDMSADLYYEVVRLMDGKILFLDDHLLRLRQSLSGSGLDYPGDQKVMESLKLLVTHNDFRIGNIRICLQKSAAQEPDLLVYFIPYDYPAKRMYQEGVTLVTYPHERPNPGIKKWDNYFRTSVNEHINSHGAYEALLVNERGEITEGSRSNVFFIDHSGCLVSPPSGQILHGITRKYVLWICREEGIENTERPVLLNEMDKYISCFISGTSPKVLPARKLDQIRFEVGHPVLKRIMERFESILTRELRTIV
jgi:branched-chain amino acid aminotransferase